MNLSEKPLVIPIFIPHAGCPHQCAFCNQATITSSTSQCPDESSIHQTISSYIGYRGKRKHVELAFFGGNFLGLPGDEIERLLKLIKPYIREGTIHGIRFSTRPDTITPRTLDLIRNLGVCTVELGVQSMNDEVLNASKRGHTRAVSIQAVDRLRAAGYRVGVQVMAGLPGENETILLQSTRDAAGLAPDFARIYPLMVLRGSPLEKWFCQGRYTPLSLDTAVHLVKKMYILFRSAGVEVIRMGLQASDFMEDKTKVVAGPWHPAFGHLVFSSLFYDLACEKIDACLKAGVTGALVLHVHPRSESRLRGDKNANLEKLQQQYPECRLSIARDSSLSLSQISVRG